jgi:hypothetical protein
MSEELINQITLDCLVDKEVFTKMHEVKKQKMVNKRDKKFYRKRILNLTKELLIQKEDNYNEINPDIKNSFDNYIRTCIQYFKVIDNNDILQEEYKILNMEKQDEKNNSSIDIAMHENTYDNEKDRLFMRSVKMKHNLDNFVKITTTKKPEEIILPKLKEINLQDPILRIKGIRKKENIDINYEDKKQNKE